MEKSDCVPGTSPEDIKAIRELPEGLGGLRLNNAWALCAEIERLRAKVASLERLYEIAKRDKG